MQVFPHRAIVLRALPADYTFLALLRPAVRVTTSGPNIIIRCPEHPAGCPMRTLISFLGFATMVWTRERRLDVD